MFIRHSKSRLYGVVLYGILILIIPAPVYPGSYALIQGKGVEVCEAYLQNLNAFHPPIPMMCLRKIHPSSKGFSKPDFEDFYTSEAMMATIDRFLWERDANPVYYIRTERRDEWQGTPEQYTKAWKAYLRNREKRLIIGHKVTSVDIDNDGTYDNVYLDQACGSSFGSIMLVLNDDKTDIDYKKTELVMRHPSRKEAGWPVYQSVKKGDWGVPPSFVERGYMQTPDALHHVYYDVFIYKDKTYFDQWWDGHIDFKGESYLKVGKLRVYKIMDNKANEICTYNFRMTRAENN